MLQLSEQAGAVGEEVFRVMEELNFPVNKVVPLASARSAGSKIEFLNKDVAVLELTETVFEEQRLRLHFFVQVEVFLRNLQNLQWKQELL